jgi:hypothetical protein
MAMNARKVKNTGGKKAPLIEAGVYPGRLQGVIDLGLQPQEYAGEAKTPKNELWATYELSDEFMPGEDGEPDETKPRWFSERFPLNNLSSDLANSTKRYYALDPNEEVDGDWAELIARPVMITIVVKGEYNNIGGTSAMRPKDAAKLNKLVNAPRLFSMDEPDLEVFLSLPPFVQDWIKGGLEFEGSKLEVLLADHKSGAKATTKVTKKEAVEDDSIPFDQKDEKNNHGVPADAADGDDW